MTDLVLDTTAEPATWAGKALDPLGDGMAAMASTTHCIATDPRHFGLDDTGLALHTAIDQVRVEIGRRLEDAADCARAGSTVLARTSLLYASLVASNTVTER